LPPNSPYAVELSCKRGQVARPRFTAATQGKIMKVSQLFAALILTIATAATAAMPMADGEVRKIDLSAKKITIKHGEIKNLDMPPMTMVFQVKDPALLEKVKVGDKVQFTVENANGAMTVLTIEPAKK